MHPTRLDSTIGSARGERAALRVGPHTRLAPELASVEDERYGPSMARTLRWVALFALLAIPVIGYLGRRTTSDTCIGRVWGDCDILYTSPGWAKPAEFVALGTAVLLLIIAAVVKRSPDDDGGSEPRADSSSR